ncbi:MAG: acetyl-CoA decarbonylase/synthase complex subunit gamma [Dehalococcoidales bacterium]|nr:acetyl-CoA decarbonylase/synthase complex subunit gamma [Dehalococcoidales bacterium]
MALTGIEIFKLLPKTNCGKCGVPTCLAFAMQLAAGKADLSACPTVSEETKAKLSEASAPPIRPLTIGTGDRALKVGGETVLFRHEKRFENPPGIAVLISDTMSEDEIDKRLDRLNSFTYERVGLSLRPEMAAVKCESGQADRFASLVSRVKQKSDCSLILMSTDPEVLSSGLKASADRKPLLYTANRDNVEKVTGLAKDSGCPVAVKGTNLEEVSALTEQMTKAGIKDIVIDSGSRSVRQVFNDQIHIRKAALGKYRPLGFPTIAFPCEMTDDPMKEAMIASMLVAKYAGIIVLSNLEGHSLFPLLVERMNIYTDPQKPLATKEGIYEIGVPDENSPVLLTSNFSLTYFIVSGEIENSKVPAYLLVKDTEGLSVMTAWAAGKFVADVISPFIKKCGIADKVKHRTLVIPGYAASESGGLEEELPDWKIEVGPREAAHIPAYLKTWKPK